MILVKVTRNILENFSKLKLCNNDTFCQSCKLCNEDCSICVLHFLGLSYNDLEDSIDDLQNDEEFGVHIYSVAK